MIFFGIFLVDYEAPPLGGSQEYASATALALGVAIAIMAIIVAALLAAYCVKRKGGFKGTGHRTLTSFENPVYEYENNAAVKVIWTGAKYVAVRNTYGLH